MSQFTLDQAKALLATGPTRISYSTDPWANGTVAVMDAFPTLSEPQCHICGPTGGFSQIPETSRTGDWWAIMVTSEPIVACPDCMAGQLASPENNVDEISWT